MTRQNAHTNARYCAFKGHECTESFEKPAEGRVFAAYSSTSPMSYNMAELAKRGHQIGASIVTWESLGRAGARIIFCDICREIERSQVVFCEISDWNHNVVFEMGFALGRQKPLVLLKDSAREFPVKFPMMDDVRYEPYKNVGEMVSRLKQFNERAGGTSDLLHAIRREIVPASGLNILYLKGGLATQSANEIQTALRKSGIELVVDDPRDSFSHVFYDLSEKVMRADLVVAHMVSMYTKDAAELNAKTALFAGLALGACKRVLILQEQPADRMLDLQNVRREYKNPGQARRYAEDWVPRQLQDVDGLRAEKEAVTRDATRRQALDRLDFGEPAAENDRKLLDYFVEMPTTEQAMAGTRYLFSGRKGSGKSAACLYLAKRLNERPHTVVSLVRPLSLQFASVKQQLERVFAGERRPYIYSAMWRFVVYTELVNAVLGSQEKLANVELSSAVQELERFKEAHGEELDGDFDDRLQRALRKATDIASQEPTWDPKGKIVEAFHSKELATMETVLKSIAEQKQLFLILDNLDQDWSPGPALERAAHVLIGLLDEAQHVNTAFKGRAKILVFLRSDIVDALRKLDLHHEKRLFFDITWDDESLVRMVAARIAKSLNVRLGSCDPREVWASAFPAATRGEPTPDYMLKRSLKRPRDLVWYCSIALDKARMRGHERIMEDDVVDSEKEYSRQILQNVLMEYTVGEAGAEEAAICLVDSTPVIKGRDLIRLLRAAPGNKGSRAPIHEYLDTLYRAGVLGVVGPSGAVTYSYDEPELRAALARPAARAVTLQGRLARLARRVLRQGADGLAQLRETAFAIHPAFHATLGVLPE